MNKSTRPPPLTVSNIWNNIGYQILDIKYWMLNVEYQILNVEYQILNIWNFELERFLCLHNDAPPPFVLKLSPLHLLPESPNIKQARKLQDAQAESWQIYKLQMTISDDTYPRYMIHDQWWWYMMIIMIYDTWYMITMMIYVLCFMIWYDMFNLDIWWSWWYMIHDDDICFVEHV